MKKHERNTSIVLASVVYDKVTGSTSIITTDELDEMPTFLLPDVIGDMKFDLDELSGIVDDLVEERRQEILARSN